MKQFRKIMLLGLAFGLVAVVFSSLRNPAVKAQDVPGTAPQTALDQSITTTVTPGSNVMGTVNVTNQSELSMGVEIQIDGSSGTPICSPATAPQSVPPGATLTLTVASPGTAGTCPDGVQYIGPKTYNVLTVVTQAITSTPIPFTSTLNLNLVSTGQFLGNVEGRRCAPESFPFFDLNTGARGCTTLAQLAAEDLPYPAFFYVDYLFYPKGMQRDYFQLVPNR